MASLDITFSSALGCSAPRLIFRARASQGRGANTIFNNFTGTSGFGPGGVCQNTTAGGQIYGVCSGRNNLDVDWFGTVRGRLGYAFGNTLIYGTGGFAAGGVRATSLYTDNNIGNDTGGGALGGNNPGTVQTGRVSNSATNTGWTAGAGIEVKLSPSWSLKGEYQFINLGTISSGPGDIIIPTTSGGGVSAPCSVTPPSDCLHLTSSKDVDFHTVRVGLNYYFNAPRSALPLK